MSSQNFEHSTPSGSEGAAAYQQLRSFFEHEKARQSYQKVFSTNNLFDIAGGVGASLLARALSYLVVEGLVEQIVRVEPRLGEGIGDFHSIEEIPDVIEDWRHPGNEVRVLPEHLRVYYKLHQ